MSAVSGVPVTEEDVLRIGAGGPVSVVISLAPRECSGARLELLRSVLELAPGESDVKLRLATGAGVVPLRLPKCADPLVVGALRGLGYVAVLEGQA